MGTLTWVFIVSLPVMICVMVIGVVLMARTKGEPAKQD